ncbi:hypothetical protein GCM10023185_19800 [Hymenobacter saemangeumensis]|uniref:Fibronectin type-III domain-containing protein n=1 Tax=Hymenobacter saemangeumensis TaxID=1084522 RepID=A0ABP8ICV7_9BACT
MNTPLHKLLASRLSKALVIAGLLLGSQAALAQVDTYQFAASGGTFTPLTGGTTVSSIQSDDALSASLPIGFSFTFDGAMHTQVKASSNGWLTFNQAASSNSLNNDLDNGTAAERPRVAPYWDDMHGGQGTASYATTGTAPNRVFTFEWLNWYRFGNTGGPSISFQVKLFETTNVVQFVYRQEPTPMTGASASIGLSGTGMGTGSFLSLSDAVANPSVSSTTEFDMIMNKPPTGQIYQFTPPVPSACPTPRNLTATVSGVTATVNWTVASGGGTFSVIYGPTGFNPATGGTTLGPITGNSTIISNLAPGSYQFYVRQNCGGTAGNSNLSSAGGFSVACPSPTALSAGMLTNTTAALSWASPSTMGATFTIIYGPTGFSPTTGGTRVTGITGTSHTLTGLMPNTAYQFYVQQVCLGGGTGTIAGPASFTTPLTAPSNDEPCGALALTGNNITASNVGATTTQATGITLPACSPSAAPKDVWFTMTPTGTSTSLTLTGNPAGMVRVYTTADCANGPFAMVACQASAGNNQSVGTVSLTGLTPGQRYYVAVSGFGSSDTNGTFTISGTALATRAQAETAALVVYPNPSSSGQLTLRLEAAPAAGQALLVNALGQQVRALALPAATLEHTLSTRGLAAGIYTLRVQRGSDLLSRKVVIE